jgi:aminopeptidase N
MKKHLAFIIVLVTQFGFSQTEDKEYQNMLESEMKSGSKVKDFKVNPNTLNYDITYHKLEFTVDPAVSNIVGKVTTDFTALANMNSITFDLYKNTTGAFTISSVKKDGVAITNFVHNSTHELVITFPGTISKGTKSKIEISYSGVPNSSAGSFKIGTHGTGSQSKPVLWTLSEPYGARDWWPCKQDLNDKVNTIDVYIKAPSAYKSVSNGIEQTDGTDDGTNKVTHFKHTYPIPAYLIAIAVTNYQIYNQQGGLGTAESPFFPIVNYLYPEEATTSETSLEVTPRIINFFETIIGPYPFRNEKYGHARANLGGGMEHTTVSFMNSWGRRLIAHEMAHQWFGDKITCGSWKDIWLNEGITEYMAGCVVENFDGDTEFVNWKKAKIKNITDETNGNLYLTDQQLTNVGRIFDSRITYNKGSMVTHMLRFKMGDDKFFEGLRAYLADPAYAYNYAITPQFQAKMESIYGASGSLQEFFDDWVYKQGYPIYNVSAFNSATGKATIQINQTQSDPSVNFFEMPVPVRLIGASGQSKEVILDHTFSGQSFVVDVPFTVTGIVFDPNQNIISKNNTATLGIEDYKFAASIRVFPNPSSETVTIEMPSNATLEKVVFYNTVGQKSLESTQNKINVSQLASGIYTASLATSEGTYHKKFIKN